MKLYKNDKLVCDKVKFVNPFLGLMFSKIKDEIVVLDVRKFKNIFVHMLFVFFKLDIICLDENFKVVKVFKNVRPFVDFFRVDCGYLLEFRSGKYNFDVGDVVSFSFSKKESL